MKLRKIPTLLAILAFLLPGGTRRANAADKTWDGGGNKTEWSTSNGTPRRNNWTDDTAFNSGDNAIFAGDVDLALVVADPTLTVGRITFNNTAGAFNIGGTATLIITNGVVNNDADNQTLSVTTITLGASQTWNAASGNLTFSGTTLNLGSSHTLTIDGANNTSIANNITGVASGITKIGAGTLTLSGANTYSGNTTISGGTLKLGANNVIANGTSGGNVAVNSGATFDVAGFSETINGLSGNGVLDNSGGAVTFQIGDNNASSTFGGTIQDSGSALSVTKIGTGVLTLNGNNTYDGLTTISGGILKLGSTTALGTTAAGTTVNIGAALDLNGQSVGAESVTLNGTGVSSGGALINSLGTPGGLSGTLTLATSASFGGSGNMTLSGNISGGSGSSFTKVGSGTVTLSGNNNFSGGVILKEGTVQLGANNALGSGNLEFAGGILNANNRSVNMGVLSLTADSTLNLLDDGTTSSLTFSSATWTTGFLTINGWSGIEQIGSDDDAIIIATAPTQDFLNHVLFQLDSGLYFAEMSGNELVPSLTPVPEPTEWALIIFATLAVFYKFAWPRLRGARAGA